jgi:DNA-binding IscR family transcriptional regulator
VRITHKVDDGVRAMVALARADAERPAVTDLLDAPGAWSTR